MEIEWVAVYGQDEFFRQFNEDDTENKYMDIDRKKLIEFHILDRGTGKTVFALALEPEQRLIFRRRNSLNASTGDMNWTIYLVGWQQTVGGKNIQSLNWIFPDGSIIATGKFKEEHPIFYGIQLFPNEDISIE